MSAETEAAAAVPRFEVTGPLPTGITVLEASAGTGKTFTIAGLAARYVAGGTPLRDLLIVTFTRNATSELRDRVRERLVSAEQGLADMLDGAPPQLGDDLLALLADAPDAEVERRRERLAAALADFDAATIVTTHGFCQEVLEGLGVAGDLEPGVQLVDDVRDLVDEVVDDLYVRRFHGEAQAAFDRRQAGRVADAAVRSPTAPLEPAGLDDGSRPAMRRRLAEAVRRELELRKRRLGVMTYDDLLTRLDAALDGPRGPQIAARLRDRYAVVLVDEFQDTDPVQWDIMRRAFGEPGSTLVLIGDPKQAIYAFRGADVYAYLAARDAAATHATLDVNWRSDGPLIDAYDALFGRAQLGHPGIAYRPVSPAPANRRARLAGAPQSAALRLRVVARDTPGLST
ncbi:MAG TPA: UvrD-helicase domain-containing protein, partial [Capillimicrobium sp.]